MVAQNTMAHKVLIRKFDFLIAFLYIIAVNNMIFYDISNLT